MCIDTIRMWIIKLEKSQQGKDYLKNIKPGIVRNQKAHNKTTKLRKHNHLTTSTKKNKIYI